MGDEFLAQLRSAQGGATTVALRVAVAAGLGICVALLHRWSRPANDRHPGFGETITLLAPLIAMVTMAVGENIAAAFTLVGTLAIVRFRTAVRDARDTVFVVFAVAVGMALGAGNPEVAIMGMVIVGGVVLVLGLHNRSRDPREESAVLSFTITPPDRDLSPYDAVVTRFAKRHAIVRSEIRRRDAQLAVTYRLEGVDSRRLSELTTTLLELPDVVRASVRGESEE